jgi:hypothetical protein
MADDIAPPPPGHQVDPFPTPCQHCGRRSVGKKWMGLPPPWFHTDDQAITWRAGWLCAICQVAAYQMFDRVAEHGYVGRHRNPVNPGPALTGS